MPRVREISNKQNLVKNYRKMQEKYGRKHFDFHGDGFNFPEDYE